YITGNRVWGQFNEWPSAGCPRTWSGGEYGKGESCEALGCSIDVDHALVRREPGLCPSRARSWRDTYRARHRFIGRGNPRNLCDPGFQRGGTRANDCFQRRRLLHIFWPQTWVVQTYGVENGIC